MLSLVWSRESAVKEEVVAAYKRLYIEVEPSDEERGKKAKKARSSEAANAVAQNFMMLVVWIMRPNTINPWYRRDIHILHHKVSGTPQDLEERLAAADRIRDALLHLGGQVFHRLDVGIGPHRACHGIDFVDADKAEIVDLLIGLLFLLLVARLNIEQFVDFFNAGGG